MKFGTVAVHGVYDPREHQRAITPPIYATSTFTYDDMQFALDIYAGKSDAYTYSDVRNPTRAVLQETVARLEGAESAQAMAAGMGAISTTLFSILKPGDHVIGPRCMYAPTYRLLTDLWGDLGVTAGFVDMRAGEQIAGAVRPETKLLYIEELSNPTLELPDLEAAVSVARENGLVTVMDNTFLTPYNLRPIERGVDIVVHSATKYFSGHGHTLGGLIVGSEKYLAPIRTLISRLGGNDSAFSAWLIIMGVKTLAVRMRVHNDNAMAVARYLQDRPAIERVLYPGLSSHPQKELADRLLDGFGGMVAYEVKGGIQAARRFLESLALCKLTVSLGDVVSLAQNPWLMTHRFLDDERKLTMGITPGMIRMSVGLEDIDDLAADLDQALRKSRGGKSRRTERFQAKSK